MARGWTVALAGLVGVASLACAGEQLVLDDGPGMEGGDPGAAAGGAPTIEALAGVWKPVIQIGGEWRFAEECGISTSISFREDQVEGGGACAFTRSSATPEGARLKVAGEGDNGPETLYVAFVDPAVPVITVDWASCSGADQLAPEAAPLQHEEKECIGN